MILIKVLTCHAYSHGRCALLCSLGEQAAVGRLLSALVQCGALSAVRDVIAVILARGCASQNQSNRTYRTPM